MTYHFPRQCLLIMVLGSLLFSCKSKPDLDKARQELLSLHQEQQTAHLSENARLLFQQSADTSISINRGKISRARRDSSIRRFERYFAGIEHKKWEDVHPPEIYFSDDGSMAYVVVDKMVVVNYPDESGKMQEESTHFAWVNIYKKQSDGQWKSVCIASTNEPSQVISLSETPVPGGDPAAR
ncbi:MAG: hypothetical protein JNM22_18535 [Saprospiraceae bacterium]|nr:hypothetical protein [Saprospiraceae bacterium]